MPPPFLSPPNFFFFFFFFSLLLLLLALLLSAFSAFSAVKQPWGQTTCTCRPARRFLLMILLPLGVRMRARKPILRARLIFDILRG